MPVQHMLRGRLAGGVLAVGLSLVLLAGVTSAQADPPSGPDAAPANASDAVQRLVALSHQSDQLNDQALKAQEDLQRKQADQRAADKKLADDRAAVALAENQIKQYQPVVDRVASVMYQGARTGSLFAVLGADQPQQLLDQMSLLEFLGNRTAFQIDSLEKAKASVEAAADAAAKSVDAARAAADKANAVRDDVRKKQQALSASISQVTAAFAQLSATDKRAYIGNPFPPGFDADTILRSLPKGSRSAALAAALTRIGDPYVWGATGPNAFDCSGLVQWAYHQVGVNLPRTSEEQANGGVPVDVNDLQPGDVVTFYSDASHVGIYAGNGMLLHASTFGVPVQVMPLSRGGPIYNARRY